MVHDLLIRSYSLPAAKLRCQINFKIPLNWWMRARSCYFPIQFKSHIDFLLAPNSPAGTYYGKYVHINGIQSSKNWDIFYLCVDKYISTLNCECISNTHTHTTAATAKKMKRTKKEILMTIEAIFHSHAFFIRNVRHVILFEIVFKNVYSHKKGVDRRIHETTKQLLPLKCF